MARGLYERVYHMTDNHTSKTELSRSLATNATLGQTVEPELARLLDSIESLRAVLCRFAPLLDSESVEVVTRSQTTLNTIRDGLNRVFAFEPTQNNQELLQNWENEGGRIECASA